MNKLTICLIALCCCCAVAKAQELSAKITVNSDRIQGTSKEVFTTMQKALNDFVNGQHWSSTTFALNEKIDCTISLTIATVSPEGTHFTAELTIQARRPVYNSSYVTSLLNFRDKQVEFDYTQGTPFEYVTTALNNNLVAIISFYSNLILGLDFDSFSPLGGSAFFREAQSIASRAQGYAAWPGWTAFDNSNNRHAIIAAFMDESLKPYREFWYTYHRKGLDEMAANPDRGRTTILSALPIMDEIRNVRSSTILVQLFSDSKLDELVALSSKATPEEKQTTYTLLNRIYPTSSSQLEPLKK